MKKYIILIALIICAACSEDAICPCTDNHSEPRNTNPLIGTWEYTRGNTSSYRIDTYTFYPDWTFRNDNESILDLSVEFLDIAKGTYRIIDSNKVELYISYLHHYHPDNPDCNTKTDFGRNLYQTISFAIRRDSKGEYLQLHTDDPNIHETYRHYKK